jgi:hypothetical protein
MFLPLAMPSSPAALRSVSLHGVALGALSLLLAGASDARAFCRLTTEMPVAGATCAQGGIPLAWHRQCISFSVMKREMPDPPLAQIRQVADQSFRTWNLVACSGHTVGLSISQTPELGACGLPEYNTHAPNANTVIFVSDWTGRDLPQDAIGLTLVWHNPDTGEIYDADMQLNEAIGSIAICDSICPPGNIDLQNVMTHEAGHFLGLGHTPVRTATMSPVATPGETSKRILADDDKQGLCAIYADLPAAKCKAQDFVPNHGFSPKCMPPSSSSMSMRSSSCSAGPAPGGGMASAGAAPLCALFALYLLRLRKHLSGA